MLSIPFKASAAYNDGTFVVNRMMCKDHPVSTTVTYMAMEGNFSQGLLEVVKNPNNN